MNRTHILSIGFVLVLALASIGKCAEPAELFLRELPSGLFLESSSEILSAQTKAIGQKLGGHVERLTNSIVRVHGRRIQVNAITAVDESNANAIHAALSKMKSYPFCLRKGRVVIEYVGADIDEALALKTSYELGLLEKPNSVRYRVIAELATVDRADYMACNPLFNLFLSLGRGTDQSAVQKIHELSQRFKFGRSLSMRNPRLSAEPATYRFQPPATNALETGATVAYSFDQLPVRQGVPYVTTTMEITVDDTGFRESASAPLKSLTAATPCWPADDPSVVELARQITAGKVTNDEKAMAILEWLAPGKNIKYTGHTGSRWGTAQVLEQKFGHCWDFSDCFVTLARAAGVPSRQVAGWFYGSSGHVWAEFYREGKGWQQVDSTGGGKPRCGIYHIPYFSSEDGEMPVLYVSFPRIEAVPMK